LHSYHPVLLQGRDGVKHGFRYAEWYINRLKNKSPVQKFFVDFHNKVYGPAVKYRDLATEFKAEMFDAYAWAEIFKSSGAKYVVLTTKHHDAFTLWPSKYSPSWNSVQMGPKADLVANITDAVRSKGLKMGYYYSLLEWKHPLYGWKTIERYALEHMIPQMKELVETYKPDLIFADGDWDFKSNWYKSTTFLKWLYNESPVKDSILVNDRWGKETRGKHGGYFTTEYDTLTDLTKKHDSDFTKPWEECRGIGASFGYNRNENLEDYSTSQQLIHILIEKVAKGGNLLLNIGPTGDGRIPVIMQQRLADIGEWLRINGEGIYATRRWVEGGSTKPPLFYTRNTKGDLFVICTEYPGSDIILDNLAGKVKNVRLLGYEKDVTFTLVGSTIKIKPPVITPSSAPCMYAWTFKVEGALNI